MSHPDTSSFCVFISTLPGLTNDCKFDKLSGNSVIGGGGGNSSAATCSKLFRKDYVTDICLDRVKVLQMLGGESVSRSSSFSSFLGGKLILNCYMAGYMSWHLALLAHTHTETHTRADTHSAICLVHDLNKDIHPPSLPSPPSRSLSLTLSASTLCACLLAQLSQRT